METKVDGDKYAVLDRIADNGFAVGLDYLLAQYEEQYGKDYKDERFVTLQQLVRDGYLKPVQVLDGVFHTISPLEVIEDDFETLALGFARSAAGVGKMLLVIPSKYWNTITDNHGYHLFCPVMVVAAVSPEYVIEQIYSIHRDWERGQQGLDEAYAVLLNQGFELMSHVASLCYLMVRRSAGWPEYVTVTCCDMATLGKLYHFPTL